MRRELLLEKIETYKAIMPWYVLDYYQSKLAVPYSFTTLYEYLKEYKRFFDWLMDADLTQAPKIADIDLSTLEHLTKKDLERLCALFAGTTFSQHLFHQRGAFSNHY